MDSEPMYMGGEGLMDRTRELNDAMWDAVLPAILGGTSMTMGALLLALAVWLYPLATPAPLAMIAVGWRLHRPWREAEAAVKAHTAAMKAERDKRGRGWSKS